MARTTSSNVTPGATLAEASGRPLALNLLISIRPGQWTKNLLIFAGLLFGNASIAGPGVATGDEVLRAI